jgi:hypothetical protein
MKNQKQDFFGAFKQLFVLLTIVVWIGWLYTFLTGGTSKFMQGNNYGRSWFDSINASGMLFMAILITIFTASLFLIKKSK